MIVLKKETYIKKYAIEYHQIAKEIKKLEEKKRALKEMILEYFSELALNKLEFDEISVSWTLIDSKKFDTTSFRNKHHDLYERFIVPYSYAKITTRI